MDPAYGRNPEESHAAGLGTVDENKSMLRYLQGLKAVLYCTSQLINGHRIFICNDKETLVHIYPPSKIFTAASRLSD
jgi:hypothetical protein